MLEAVDTKDLKELNTLLEVVVDQVRLLREEVGEMRNMLSQQLQKEAITSQSE